MYLTWSSSEGSLQLSAAPEGPGQACHWEEKSCWMACHAFHVAVLLLLLLFTFGNGGRPTSWRDVVCPDGSHVMVEAGVSGGASPAERAESEKDELD